MKTFRVPLILLLLGFGVRAQDAPAPDLLPPAAGTVGQQRSPQELEQLVAPIALYPDALIALILPASTAPTDIVLAARHLRENPSDRAQIEHRAWDDSVKSLTNYPEVVQWMDENLHWTRQLGEAFAAQPADVMQAVQRLRAQARAAGTLVDTPQQQVIAEPQVIRIVPAQPDIIYVPHYEPDIVFVDRPIYYGRPFLTFGVGVPVGSWLAFDCDWRRHSIWVGNRHRRWTGHDWHRPVVPIAPAYNYTRNPEVRQWRPPPSTVRASVTITQTSRIRPEVARPAPFGLAASRTNTYRDSGSIDRRGDFNPRVTAPGVPRNFSPGFRSEVINSQPTAPAIVTPPSSQPASPALNVDPSNPSRRGRGSSFRSDVTGPQPTVPATVTPQPNQPASPAPNVDTSNPSRRGRDWSRDGNNNRPNDNNDRSRGDDNRSRNFRNNPNPQPTNTAPVTVAPTLPSAPPRSTPQMGQTPQHSYSRSAPPPDTAPALRSQGRSAPPPAATPPPAAPAATPQPAPQQTAPVQQNGGESRGQRGTYRRGDS